MNESPEVPRKIFIESTALFQLGPRLENVDFARLLSFRDTLNVDLFTTEVNFREYMRFRKKEVQQIRSRLQEANRDLDKYGQNYAEFNPLSKQVDSFLAAIDQHFEEKFRALGIQILPLPEVGIETLVQMSIESTPPFEEKASEKGFRDAVAMFSILEEVENRPDDHALVITGDDLLAEGFRVHAPKFETVINCVDGIPEANKHIDEQLSVAVRETLRKEAEEAKAVLLRHKDILDAKIAEIREIEPMDFGGLFGIIKDENGVSLSVERVLSIKFRNIESVLWKDRDQPRSRILFRLKCEANVMVRNPYFPFLGLLAKYPIGGQVVYSKSAHAPEILEKTVPLWFYGQATLVQKNNTWVLEDLGIDRKLPGSREEFFELLVAGLPESPAKAG